MLSCQAETTQLLLLHLSSHIYIKKYESISRWLTKLFTHYCSLFILLMTWHRPHNTPTAKQNSEQEQYFTMQANVTFDFFFLCRINNGFYYDDSFHSSPLGREAVKLSVCCFPSISLSWNNHHLCALSRWAGGSDSTHPAQRGREAFQCCQQPASLRQPGRRKASRPCPLRWDTPTNPPTPRHLQEERKRPLLTSVMSSSNSKIWGIRWKQDGCP